MKESLKIAIGIFLGLSATCLCTICVLLIISGSGIALLDSVIHDLASTETPLYRPPTKILPAITITNALNNRNALRLGQYNLSLFYDPNIWKISVDQYDYSILTHIQINECKLKDGGIGEINGVFKEAIILGEYSFNIYESLSLNGNITREYLVVLGPGITPATGKPYFILTVPPFNTKMCVDDAHIVLATLHQVE